MYKLDKPKFLLIVIVSIILIFYTSFSFAGDLTKIDNAGNKILTIFRRIGFWIILIKCIQELVTCAMNGATKNIGGIITKYIMIYGAFFFVPWALRLVEGIF